MTLSVTRAAQSRSRPLTRSRSRTRRVLRPPRGRGKAGQIDISGGEVSISDSALITAASGVGQTRYSSLPAAGRRSWNPGKTPHSGPGRNAITGLAGGTIKLKAQNKAVISDKAQITVASETGTGGQIEITGDKVGLLGQARLDGLGRGRGRGDSAWRRLSGQEPGRQERQDHLHRQERAPERGRQNKRQGRPNHRLGGRHHALSRADFGPRRGQRAARAALSRSRASVIWRFGARWM